MSRSDYLRARRLPPRPQGMRTVATPRLKELREGMGTTMRKMAHDFGVEESTIYRWEIGEMAPRRAIQMMIISYFDVAWEEVFQYIPVAKKTSEPSSAE